MQEAAPENDYELQRHNNILRNQKVHSLHASSVSLLMRHVKLHMQALASGTETDAAMFDHKR